MRRKTLMREIKKIMGRNWLLRTTEEFDGSKGGIWTSGEEDGKDGLHLADYYGYDNSGFGYFVHPKIQRLLKRAGWYIEWYDAGTINIYPE